MKKVFIAALVALMSSTKTNAQIETMVKRVSKADPMLEIQAHTTWESNHIVIWQYADTGNVFFVLKSQEGLFDAETTSTKVGLYKPNGEMLSMSVMWHTFPTDDESIAGLICGYKNEDEDTIYRQKIEDLPSDDPALRGFFECVVKPEHVLKFLKNNPNGYVRVTTTLQNGRTFDAKARIQTK